MKRNFDINRLKIKYKKDQKKLVILILCVCVAAFSVFGVSYAYLTYIAKTRNTATISPGIIAIDFESEDDTIHLTKALPQEDKDAIEKNETYNFTLKNIGTLKENYVIKLENTCQVGKSYELDDREKMIDVCIPNEYIKAAINEEDDIYKTVEVNENNEIVLATGSLSENEERNYSLKVWLDWETPNTYNNRNQNIVYIGKLSVDYEQRENSEDTEIIR